MSRRKDRGSLRPLLKLLPYLRPYVGRVLLLLVVTLAFAFSDAGRALLAKPLLNKVFMRGGEVRGQVEDERAYLALPEQVRQRAAAETEALVSPLPDGLSRLKRSPDLLGAGGFRAPADGSQAAELIQRTSQVLLETADGMPLAEEESWDALARAARLQSRAVRLHDGVGAGRDEPLAVALSYRARQLAHDAGFVVAWRTLWWVFWAAIVLAVALALFNFLTLYLSRTLVAKVYLDLQNRAAEHLLTLSVRFFEGERRGDLLSRLTYDLPVTSNMITTLVDVLIRFIHLGVLVVLAVTVSWQLSIALVLLGVTVILPIRWWGKRIRRSARRRQGMAGQVVESMQQMFAGIREVKAFQREEYEGDRLAGNAEQTYRADVRAVRAKTAAKMWMKSFNDMTIPVLFALGGWFVLTRRWDLDVGTFGAFLGMVMLMYQPAKILAEGYGKVMDGIPALERVLQLFDRRPEVVDRPGARRLEGLREAITCEDLCFSYDGENRVLHDIAFSAPRGSMTALVGHTGSGKSSLVDLIARYYDPDQGRILIDGVDLRDLQLASYLDLVAVVPQENFLFNDTLRQNIRFGRLDASDEEVEDAARRAQIHEEILALPGGYDYVAGERGGRLSGGQVQRISIARAILNQPEILILDEATSALDTETEQRVQRALEELTQRTTTFVIAHRLSTVQRADQILVLAQGRLVERGRHDELTAQGGVYAGLVARQLQTPDD